jgi:hypothetical protein
VRTSSPVTRLVPLAVVALLAVALAACSSATPSTQGKRGGGTSTTTTTTTTAPTLGVVGFYPYTPQGTAAQGLQVTQKVSGRCTSPGVAGGASYRCTGPGSVAYDPCFAPPLATKGPLLCVPDPTDTDVAQFSAGALPTAPAHTPQKQVWAMRLQNGEVCIHVRASWKGLGPYACPTPSATSSVADCHAPEHAAHGWTTACQAEQNASSPFRTLKVGTVWD